MLLLDAKVTTSIILWEEIRLPHLTKSSHKVLLVKPILESPLLVICIMVFDAKRLLREL